MIPPAEARAIYNEMTPQLQPEPASVAEVRDLTAPGPAGPIKLRCYRGADATSALPAMIYFHGGGWLLGDLDLHDGICRWIASVAGVIVVSVDYALAPRRSSRAP